MPDDAKLGLMVGVGLVIAVAVIFFRKELPGQASVNGPPAAVVRPVAMPAPAQAPNNNRTIPARVMSNSEEAARE